MAFHNSVFSDANLLSNSASIKSKDSANTPSFERRTFSEERGSNTMNWLNWMGLNYFVFERSVHW